MHPLSRRDEAILRTKGFDSFYEAYLYLDDLINIFGFKKSFVLPGTTQYIAFATD